VPLPSSGAPVTLLLGDLRSPDGTEWACCPRTLLRRTLDELHWSADSPRLALQDREALLRIPGPAATTGTAAHPHLEFRAAGSTANPWLAWPPWSGPAWPE